MGQLGDEHLDTSETESMTAIALPLEHTQDFIQKRNPSRVSAPTGLWTEHNESDLAHVVSTHLPSPRPTVITMVMRKNASG